MVCRGIGWWWGIGGFGGRTGTGAGSLNLLDQFGFGNYSPAISFLMMPIYSDLLRIQAIEYNDQIRKAAYSFQLRNNKLRIFPKPLDDFKLHFNYILSPHPHSISTVWN